MVLLHVCGATPGAFYFEGRGKIILWTSECACSAEGETSVNEELLPKLDLDPTSCAHCSCATARTLCCSVYSRGPFDKRQRCVCGLSCVCLQFIASEFIILWVLAPARRESSVGAACTCGV